VALDLFRGMARPERNDIDLNVSNVRISLYGKPVERDDSTDRQQDGEC
jgi:hypothetical protein